MAAYISGGQGSKQTAESAAQNDGTWPQHPERTLQREGREWKSLGLGGWGWGGLRPQVHSGNKGKKGMGKVGETGRR